MNQLTNCPHCNSKLDPEEITANECWVCRKPLTNPEASEFDTEIDDETMD